MKRRGGFSLVELLVALAITSLLVVLLTNVVSATLTAWQQGRSRLDTFSSARQLIGRIADEISGAIAIKDRIEFVENSTSLQGANPPAAKTSENIFFVAPYPNSAPGDLCVIAIATTQLPTSLSGASSTARARGRQPPANRYKSAAYPDPDPTEWRTVAEGVIEFEIRSYSQTDIDNEEVPGGCLELSHSWTKWKAKRLRRVVLRIKVVDDRR